MNVQQVKVMIMMTMLIMCDIIQGISNVLLHIFVPSKIIKEKMRCTIAKSMMMMLIMCEIIHRMSNVLLHSFVPSKIIKEKTWCTIAKSIMYNTTMWFLSTPFRLIQTA